MILGVKEKDEVHKSLEGFVVEDENIFHVVLGLLVWFLPLYYIQDYVDLLEKKTHVLQDLLLPSVEVSQLAFFSVKGVWELVQSLYIIRHDLENVVKQAHVGWIFSWFCYLQLLKEILHCWVCNRRLDDVEDALLYLFCIKEHLLDLIDVLDQEHDCLLGWKSRGSFICGQLPDLGLPFVWLHLDWRLTLGLGVLVSLDVLAQTFHLIFHEFDHFHNQTNPEVWNLGNQFEFLKLSLWCTLLLHVDCLAAYNFCHCYLEHFVNLGDVSLFSVLQTRETLDHFDILVL